jgi:general stress protein 26
MKTTTAERDPKAFQKLQAMVREIDVAMITTVTPDGALRSRPMATREFEDQGVIWFITADDTGQAEDLEAEHAVCLSYSDPRKHQFVSISGSASLVRNREKTRELWDNSLNAYIPGGANNPHLALLSVRIETAEFWDASASKMVEIFSGEGRSKSGEHTKVDVRATPASG